MKKISLFNFTLETNFFADFGFYRYSTKCNGYSPFFFIALTSMKYTGAADPGVGLGTYRLKILKNCKISCLLSFGPPG